MTPARRFIVRTSLVTGSTIATIVGAQSLALLDLQKNTQADAIAEPTQPTTVNADVINTVQSAPTIITDSAPSISIIRRPADQTTTNTAPTISINTASAGSTISNTAPSNQTTTNTQTNQVTTQIVPPSPVQSQPVTISMPQQPTTRSSR